MKYWEVVKSLTENSALSGVAVIGSIRYELYVDDSGTLQSATYYLQLGTKGTSIGEAGNIDFDGWEIVRQPVTWQKAIQAWVDGKKVSYSYMGYDKRFPFEDSNTMMSIEKVKNAEWYVED
jgi:hypothetical protein